MEDNTNGVNENKFLLLKSDESTLTIWPYSGNLKLSQVKMGKLTLDGTARTFKIFVYGIYGHLRLQLVGGGVWSITLHGSVIKALVMGGTGCVWDDASCLLGQSRIFYRSFVGHFGAVSINEEKKTFGDIITISASKRRFTIVRFISTSIYSSFKLVCTIFQIRPLRDL